MSYQAKLCPECRMENRMDARQCVCGHFFESRIAPDHEPVPRSAPEVHKTYVQSPPQAVAAPPPQSLPPQQYPQQYPGQYPQQQYPQQQYPQQQYPQQRYPQQRYPQQQYPAQAYSPPQYPQQPYPPPTQYQQPPFAPQYPPQAPGDYPVVPQPYMAPYPVLYSPSGIIQKLPGTHTPATSVLLGFLLLGLGQMINGQVAKGVVMLFGGAAFILATGGFGALAIWPLSLIDAALIAGRLNRGEPVRQWQWF